MWVGGWVGVGGCLCVGVGVCGCGCGWVLVGVVYVIFLLLSPGTTYCPKKGPVNSPASLPVIDYH